jgi:hypothetical protein
VSGGLPSPTHIKIDVDGLEHRVIDGAVATLANGVQSLLVEVNTGNRLHMQMVEKLQSFGFKYDQWQVEKSIRKEGSFKGVSEYLFRKEQKFSYCEVPDKSFREAKVETEPFPWVYVENVFPPDIYASMLENLPKNYVEISKSRLVKGYPQRFTAVPDTEFWRGFQGHLRSGNFKRTLCEMFGVPNPDSLTDECLLIRDHAGYHIGPHTDSPEKVITVLFYMPKDDSLITAGTSIYAPLIDGFRCKGGPHYPSDEFKILHTMPFKPNSAFAFLKTDNSFHGVVPCSGTRDVLLYDIRKT